MARATIAYLEQRYTVLEKETADALRDGPTDDLATADLKHRKLIIANEIRDNRRLVEPLDLERRLERRWAVRFFCTKRIALKGCINRMPRPAKGRYALDRPPARTGKSMVGSVKKPTLSRAAPSATSPRTAL
jgi:hypothetical protein